MLYINREEVESLLTYEDCIEACEEALRAKGKGEAEDIPRMHLVTEKTNQMLLPSMIKSKGYVGLRVYNVGGAPIRLMYLLWDGAGEMLAMMDAMWIRDIRTGSVGAVSAKYLARPESTKLAVLGSGRQARSGLSAHAKAFKLGQVRIYSPNEEHRKEFARDLSPVIDVDIEPVDSGEKAVAGADIILTGSSKNAPGGDPVLPGAWLAPGMHVSCIGGRAELDDEAVRRADRVIIDSKQQFPYECRDITTQVENGVLTWEDIHELHDVVAGNVPARRNATEITLVKTVGTPLQDLLPAAKVYELAKKKGAGKDLGDLFPPSGGWYGTNF